MVYGERAEAKCTHRKTFPWLRRISIAELHHISHMNFGRHSNFLRCNLKETELMNLISICGSCAQTQKAFISEESDNNEFKIGQDVD